MDPAHVETLLAELRAELSLGAVRRESIRVWEMSGVERLRLDDGRTLIFKYSRGPLTDEHLVLRHAAAHGLPVPRLLASATLYDPRLGVGGDSLGMVMEDLGPAVLTPTLEHAVAAALAVHAVSALPGRPGLDSAALAALPGRALKRLATLQSAGRWQDPVLARHLRALAAVAYDRCHGAEIPPWGMLHSEFHPTSLHVDASGRWRLLDMARACTGPGVLDLVSWQGTQTAPETAALYELLVAYVAAGGPATALSDRAGLPVTRWAIGWHRLWIVDWYLEQAARWMPDPALDEHAAAVVVRHLAEAIDALGA
ncbi:hypothetical protein GCM10029978_045760 [Actinoallomurus acanthiterrae]